MPQLTYNDNMAAGYPGMQARGGDISVDTGENTTMALPFGRGVARITGSERGVALPAATGFQFAGVVMHEHLPADSSGVVQHPQNSAVPVMRRGFIFVWSEVAVSPTDPVYCRHTANGAGKDPGQFLKTADTDKADQITGVRWASKTSGAGLAVLELNLP